MANKVVQKLKTEYSTTRVNTDDTVESNDNLPIEMLGQSRQKEGVLENVSAKSVSRIQDRQVQLISGRLANFRSGDKEDHLVVTSNEGRVELSVRFTESGPVLDFEAAGIQLKSRGEVAVQCSTFRVEATEKIQVSTNGEMVQEINGHAHVEARTIDMRARRGNVNLKANDDIRLLGERIKLNC